MNAFLAISLCLCVLTVVSDGVTVKVGDFSFSLESVKKLKDISAAPPVQRSPSTMSICGNPKLPTEFRPLCVRPNSRLLMAKLQAIVRDVDVCEICVNVACTGC